MKPPPRGARGAAAGLALTAAGMLYSRLGARRRARPEPEPGQPAEAHDPSPPSAAVERARTELAEELARRSSRSEG